MGGEEEMMSLVEMIPLAIFTIIWFYILISVITGEVTPRKQYEDWKRVIQGGKKW